jgi:signal transduction histidine kinase/ActR/RegA family two-component response regulator
MIALRLDVPTLFVATSATAALLGVLFLVLGRQKGRVPGLTRFGVAHVLGAVAIILAGARGALPNPLSIDVANALLICCYGLIWSTMRAFGGRRTPLGLVLVGGAVWLLACQVPAFYTSLSARVALSATLLAIYCFAAAAELRRNQPAPLAARWIAVVLLAVHGAIYAVRGPLAFAWPMPGGGFALPSGPWFELLTLECLLHMVGMAFAVLAMAKERAEALSRQSLVTARDAAAQAGEVKSRFLARMSHELRTPLNSVLGLAQVLARDPRLAADQREQAETLERAGRHLLAVANDVLDLAAVEAGKLQLRAGPVPLPALIEGCASLVRPQAAAKGIALRHELAPGTPAAVLGDATRLRQMVLNLLSNAVKFTPEGGEVGLRALRAAPAGALRIEISDTGPGIPPERRDLLFRDFSRLEAAPGQEFGGAGLGLAISAALARAMGGSIGCDTGPGGRGSLFWIELPLEEAAGPLPPPEPPPEAAPARPRRRVLVVDDVTPNRLVARVLLERAGHAVELAADGAEAVAALRRGGFDLVLMDVHMPGMDGLEATRRIRALEGAGRRVPIIALTADALGDQIEQCLAAGMDGHLTKPLDRAALLALVDRAEAAPA